MNWIERLRAERTSLADAARKIVEGAAAESRDLSDTEKASHADMENRVAVIDDQLHRLVGEARASRDIADLVAAETRAEAEQATATAPAHETRSVGEQFAHAREIMAWGGRGQSPIIEVETRALLTTSDGYTTSGAQIPGNIPRTRTPLYDAVSKIPVTGNSYEYPVWEQWEAGEVAEGAPKPEAGGYTMESGALATWAHWKKMSRQYRQDNAYLAALVDQQLEAGVRRKAEDAAVEAVVGTSTAPVTGPDLLSAIRAAIAAVESSEDGLATHLLIHPDDSALIDIDAMERGHAGAVLKVGTWGLVTITNPAVTEGTPIVFDIAAVVALVRTGVETYMTDSDISGAGSTAASDFRANILTVLSEARGKVLLQDPRLAVPANVVVAPLAASAKSSK